MNNLLAVNSKPVEKNDISELYRFILGSPEKKRRRRIQYIIGIAFALFYIGGRVIMLTLGEDNGPVWIAFDVIVLFCIVYDFVKYPLLIKRLSGRNYKALCRDRKPGDRIEFYDDGLVIVRGEVKTEAPYSSVRAVADTGGLYAALLSSGMLLLMRKDGFEGTTLPVELLRKVNNTEFLKTKE